MRSGSGGAGLEGKELHDGDTLLASMRDKNRKTRKISDFFAKFQNTSCFFERNVIQ
jgi:hypothetical protein